MEMSVSEQLTMEQQRHLLLLLSLVGEFPRTTEGLSCSSPALVHQHLSHYCQTLHEAKDQRQGEKYIASYLVNNLYSVDRVRST